MKNVQGKKVWQGVTQWPWVHLPRRVQLGRYAPSVVFPVTYSIHRGRADFSVEWKVTFPREAASCCCRRRLHHRGQNDDADESRSCRVSIIVLIITFDRTRHDNNSCSGRWRLPVDICLICTTKWKFNTENVRNAVEVMTGGSRGLKHQKALGVFPTDQHNVSNLLCRFWKSMNNMIGVNSFTFSGDKRIKEQTSLWLYRFGHDQRLFINLSLEFLMNLVSSCREKKAAKTRENTPQNKPQWHRFQRTKNWWGSKKWWGVI